MMNTFNQQTPLQPFLQSIFRPYLVFAIPYVQSFMLLPRIMQSASKQQPFVCRPGEDFFPTLFVGCCNALQHRQASMLTLPPPPTHNIWANIFTAHQNINNGIKSKYFEAPRDAYISFVCIKHEQAEKGQTNGTSDADKIYCLLFRWTFRFSRRLKRVDVASLAMILLLKDPYQYICCKISPCRA